MSAIYEIQCFPPNEAPKVVRLQAATLEEAMQRADKLWMRQFYPPRLLAIVDQAP